MIGFQRGKDLTKVSTWLIGSGYQQTNGKHATLDGRGDAAGLFDDTWAREGLHMVRRVRGGKLGEGRPDHSYQPDELRLARESV